MRSSVGAGVAVAFPTCGGSGQHVRMIGRLHHTVIDCPDPQHSALFWSAVLSVPISYDDGDFVVVSQNEVSSGLAFQRSVEQRPATWPDPAIPQQMHFDVMVEDVIEAGRLILEVGARKLGDDVYADPAGHPFCLIKRPRWAPPLNTAT